MTGAPPPPRPTGAEDSARFSSRGFVTMFTAGLLFSLLAMVGVVADSGRALRHRSDAFGAAAAAARAGAQEIDEGHAVQTGQARINQAEAEAAVRRYLDTRGADVTLVEVRFPGSSGTQVEVTVSGSTDLWILPGGSVGFTVSATATAIQGVPGS